ncbi:MAG: sodium-dependent transporter, partial [Pseudobdellovibrionaceae bacterium]
TVVIVGQGVREGIEKWITVAMPFFVMLLMILLVRNLSLPASSEVVRFLFYPDFSKLTLSSLMQAIGHVLFTLSIGFGVMVTFGSYLRSEDHIPTAGFRVSLVDMALSLTTAMAIFPIAFMASSKSLKNPVLLFEVLPQYLAASEALRIFGVLFFCCLYMAALNASIILLEVIVSNWKDKQKKLKRIRITWFSGCAALLFSILPALSSTVLKDFTWGKKSLIEILDTVLINWILPLVALGFVWLFASGTSASWRQKEFVDKTRFVSTVMYEYWEKSLLWLIPGLIIFAYVLQVIDLLG